MPASTKDIERVRYSRDLAEYTLKQFLAARKILDSRGHEEAAAKLPARHAARDGTLPPHQGQQPLNGHTQQEAIRT